MCYLGGYQTDTYAKNKLEPRKRFEIRDYIQATKRESFMTGPMSRNLPAGTDYSNACQKLTERGECKQFVDEFSK